MYYKFNMFKASDVQYSNGNNYFDDTTIRKIKLTPCNTSEECFADYGSWGVYRPWDKSDKAYNCKDENEAYDYLLESLNNNIYEARYDI